MTEDRIARAGPIVAANVRSALVKMLNAHGINKIDWSQHEDTTNEIVGVVMTILAPPAAIADIAAERRRQIERLGWTTEHDDSHDRDGALSRAAACYAVEGDGIGSGLFRITHLQTPQQVWPYRWEWKPKDRRTNLVRAAALIVAEIERLDRAAALKESDDD